MANAIHIQKAINYFHEAPSEAEKIKAARYFVEVMAEVMGIPIDHAIEKAKDVIASKVPGEEKYVDYAFMEQAEKPQPKQQAPVERPIPAVKKPKEITKPGLENVVAKPMVAPQPVLIQHGPAPQPQPAVMPTQVVESRSLVGDDTLAVLGSAVIVGGIVWWLATR